MKEIRIYDIPKQFLREESPLKKTLKTLMEQRKSNIELYNHIVSTANFVYMYCQTYEKTDEHEIENMFIAAVLFNFWKVSVPKETLSHRDKTHDEEVKTAKTIFSMKNSILKTFPKEITDIIYITDKDMQHMHEIIYTCNALDNLLCLKDEEGKQFSIPVAMSILASSRNYNPSIVKKLRDFFTKNITKSSEEFKITFSSKEEMKDFESMSDDQKDSLFSVVSLVATEDNGEVDIKEINKLSPKREQIIMFSSENESDQKFYDKNKKILYKA